MRKTCTDWRFPVRVFLYITGFCGYHDRFCGYQRNWFWLPGRISLVTIAGSIGNHGNENGNKQEMRNEIKLNDYISDLTTIE